jgi:hypothetical protein
MRFLVSALMSVTLAVLVLGSCAAQKNDEAEKAKRISEIEKEIAALQARIGKLTAELAKLQPAPKSVPESRERGDTTLGGTIVKLIRVKEQTTGFYLNAMPPEGVIIYLRSDTEIRLSDKTKAGPTDLKAGQVVTVRVDKAALAAKREPPLAQAYVVVIHKPKDKVKDGPR